MRTARLRAAAVVAAVGAAVVIAAPASGAGGAKVSITGDTLSSYAFAPGKVKIKHGKRVRWNWDSNAPHNVTFAKLGEHSPTGASESYSLRFKEAGTYKYTCAIHGFRGRVVVK